MNIPDYYKKYINTNGIYIVSSEAVSDDALYKASEIIALMMSKRQDIFQYMVNKGCHAMISGKDEETCDLPEYAHMCNTPESIAYWNKRARGFGGGPEDDYSASCGEENLLALPEDRYVGENILIHEFAHIIHTVGILGLEPDFDSRLEDLWQNSIDNGRWENTYAISNK